MKIIANWKNQLSIEESQLLFSKYLDLATDSHELIIAPITLSIPLLTIQREEGIHLCAQSVSAIQEKGNYTGEVLARDFKELGVTYALVGHSERRVIIKETRQELNQQVHSLLLSNMHPIYLVGETTEERKEGITSQVITQQLDTGLAGVPIEEIDNITIGYEPVWAITSFGGTTSCENQDIEGVFEVINKWLMNKYGVQKKLLYGGSVNPDNISRLTQISNIGGFVIGNASLDIEKMNSILDTINNS